MKKAGIIRFIFLGIIIIAGSLLIAIFFIKKINTPYDSTLTESFKLMGLTTKAVDRAFSRILPVDSYDEKELGEAIAKRYINNININNRDYIYLNNLMDNLEINKKKPFDYKVFPLEYMEPNAFAMPGGVIMVSKGLLEILQTEAELAAILSHEMGHVEMSHCFEMVRVEMMTKKMNNSTLGEVADTIVYLVINHSFSKTIEDEADEYAFELLKKTQYDPLSLGNSFTRFYKYYEENEYINREDDNASIIRDYFTTHPKIKLRIEKFKEKGKIYWRLHQNIRKYRGKENIKKRICFYTKDYGEKEWIDSIKALKEQ